MIKPTNKEFDVNEESGLIEEGAINRACSSGLEGPTVSSLVRILFVALMNLQLWSTRPLVATNWHSEELL